MSGSQEAGRKKNQAVYTLRIDRGQLAKFRLIADRNHRTVAQEVRQMVDDAIEREAA